MPIADGQWHVWIDRGGTFTDCVAIDPSGELRTCKLLSENPAQYDDAPLEGLRRLLGLPKPSPRGAPLDLSGVSLAEVRMGTTVATNALLTRSGEPTALVITRGFADLPEIGEQDRPDIFALDIVRPAPLHTAVLEVDARVAVDGEELQPLDDAAVLRGLQALREGGSRAVAISLLHADRHPQHERRLRELALAVGFEQVSIGSDVSPLPRLVARTDTTIVDAYLTPVLRRYVQGFRKGLGVRSEE
ncbi:MAG: hydantoinase/oxoprolinase N-terminal domain-containing protein, partial [Planctomycetota bacterium]